MGKSASPPPTPNYSELAQQQVAGNRAAALATARMSNPNIVNPLGGQTVSYTPSTDFDEAAYNAAMRQYEQNLREYQTARLPDRAVAPVLPTKEQFTTTIQTPTITQTLTPEAQAALESQQRVQRALSGLGEKGIEIAKEKLGMPFQYTGPEIQTGLGDVGQMPVSPGMTTQQAIMARLQPQLQQQRSQLNTELINQGLRPGTEAYNTAMQQQSQRENDLLSQAALQGVGTDIAAQNQRFNQALQAGQFGNVAAQQRLQQELGLYNQPLNQIAALMSGGQIQMPAFQGYQGSNVAPAPIMQAGQLAAQDAMNIYNAQQSAQNANTSGLYGLGAAGLSAYGSYLAAAAM